MGPRFDHGASYGEPGASATGPGSPAAGEIAEERDPDEAEAELETPLAADFGENLVPEGSAGDKPRDRGGDGRDEDEDGGDAPAERGAEDIEVASPEEAAPAIGEEDDHPIKAAIAPGPDGS